MTATLTNSRLNISPDLHPGYRLVCLRGIGGFGEVWEAEKENGNRVALKFLHCTGARGTAAMELRSLQIVQGLRHAHLIEIDRVWCAGAFLIVAMELADGSLTNLLEMYRDQNGSGLPAGHLLPLLTQAAKAIDFMNDRLHLVDGKQVGIQHCDITPSNLLLFGETVKLSDFSLTTMMNGSVKSNRRAGTTAYAAPEVFRGWLTHRTDQYALAVCYCQLRGGLPFHDSPDTFQPSYARPLPDLSMLTPAERPALARALSPVPEDRWGSCGQLIKELQVRTSTPKSASNPYLRRKPLNQ